MGEGGEGCTGAGWESRRIALEMDSMTGDWWQATRWVVVGCRGGCDVCNGGLGAGGMLLVGSPWACWATPVRLGLSGSVERVGAVGGGLEDRYSLARVESAPQGHD